MTYTIKPSELYDQGEVEKLLKEKNLRIIDFRPSRRGDKYIGLSYKDKLTLYNHPKDSDYDYYTYEGVTQYRHVGRTPRLIVEKIPSSYLSSIWE